MNWCHCGAFYKFCGPKICDELAIYLPFKISLTKMMKLFTQDNLVEQTIRFHPSTRRRDRMLLPKDLRHFRVFHSGSAALVIIRGHSSFFWEAVKLPQFEFCFKSNSIGKIQKSALCSNRSCNAQRFRKKNNWHTCTGYSVYLFACSVSTHRQWLHCGVSTFHYLYGQLREPAAESSTVLRTRFAFLYRISFRTRSYLAIASI